MSDFREEGPVEEGELRLKKGTHSYPMPEVEHVAWADHPSTEEVQKTLDAFLAKVESQGGQVLGTASFMAVDRDPRVRRGREEASQKLFFVIKK